MTYQEFLDSIPYPRYALTGDDQPGFTGRWYVRDVDGVPHHISANQGSNLYFLVNNANFMRIHFTCITPDDTPCIAYSIDGQPPVRQTIAECRVPLPDNGMHTVRVTCDGIAEMIGKFEENGFAFRSVEPEPGGEILGIIPTDKTIAFFGDSITDGIRTLNINLNSMGNSAVHAFPWYCSQKLQVIPYTCGFGASGVYCEGCFAPFITAIDKLSATRDVDDGYQPDLIVVNHGTNDPAGEEEAFEQGYLKAIRRLKEKYGDVAVLCLIPYCQKHADPIRRAVAQVDGCHLVETADWELTYTDGIHPNANGSRIAGEKLAEYITANKFI